MARNDYTKKRGERLAAEKRKKAKARRIIHEWVDGDASKIDPKFVGKVAHTPHSCSDMCCGNPRRHYKGKSKLTMQELRELEKER